jgi:hypothetical protein
MLLERLEVLIAHLSNPDMLNQVSYDILIFNSQVLAGQVRHENSSHHQPTDRRDYERSPLPQVHLDGCERHGPGDAVAFPLTIIPLQETDTSNYLFGKNVQGEGCFLPGAAGADHRQVEED